MSDAALKITSGFDKLFEALTFNTEKYIPFRPGIFESTFPQATQVIELEEPNELTSRTISQAESGIDIVVCDNEEDFFRKLDE